MEQAIFDLDGTLSDNSHREHLISGDNKKWREYLKKAKEDSPVEIMIKKLNKLSEKYEIVILTMRSDEVEAETKKWLKENNINYDKLIMLPEGRWSKKDHKFKQEKLEDLERPVIAFDDNKKNCKMFKNNGIETYIVDKESEPLFKRF